MALLRIGRIDEQAGDVGITLLVEHDMQVVFELADQVAVLHEGRVLACGTPAQVRADALVRQVYLNAQGGAA